MLSICSSHIPTPLLLCCCSESGPGPHRLHRRHKVAYNLSANKEGEVAQDDLVQGVSRDLPEEMTSQQSLEEKKKKKKSKVALSHFPVNNPNETHWATDTKESQPKCKGN